MKDTIIPLRRTKIAFLFFGAMGFVVLSIWLIQIADIQTRSDPMFVKIVSAVGIVFFGLSSIYAFPKIFDTKPGLVINDEGIIDNSSVVCAGLIKWENITKVSITEIYDQKILTIDVNNASEILARQRGFKKILMYLNKNYFNSPVQISSNVLKSNFQDIYNIINEQLSIRHSNS